MDVASLQTASFQLFFVVCLRRRTHKRVNHLLPCSRTRPDIRQGRVPKSRGQHQGQSCMQNISGEQLMRRLHPNQATTLVGALLAVPPAAAESSSEVCRSHVGLNPAPWCRKLWLTAACVLGDWSPRARRDPRASASPFRRTCVAAGAACPFVLRTNSSRRPTADCWVVVGEFAPPVPNARAHCQTAPICWT